MEVHREKETEVEGAAAAGQGATTCRVLLRPRMRNMKLDGRSKCTPHTAVVQRMHAHSDRNSATR